MWPLNCAFVLLIFMICSCAAKEYRIFCQYDLGSFYYKNASQFTFMNIDERLCSYLILTTGVGVNGETGELKRKPDYLIDDDELMSTRHVLYNGKLDRIVGTIGGWGAESSEFSKLAASSTKRDRFLESVIDFIYEWGFVGVQIDWRYPTQRGGRPQDRKNFITLLKELKIRLDDYGFMLMVAVLGRTDSSTLEYYDIPNLVRHVHFVSLLFHDNREPYQSQLRYNAPLSGKHSVVESIKLWKKLGKAPGKLVMSIPLFARSYIRERRKTSVGSRSKGPGPMTPLSNKLGFMTYNEWCTQAATWTQKYDEQAKVPYAYKGDQWISYENNRSILAKIELIKSQNLGGVMPWTIDSDDFAGNCGKKHSLGRVILEAIDPKAVIVDPVTTTTPAPCPKDGLFRDPKDCQLYYGCSRGEKFEYECPFQEFFDEAKSACRPMKEVRCPSLGADWLNVRRE
ncbi:endochitinase [Drosophila guanche]|uniref:Blast:Endochitinase n=1 Tax=Drosophila guanche TaxID=7266 RepID=A0A3B0JMT3_DROGU|nr:endochitinase [Drosophila guanche]SPP74859.1 blast:Endochitinase [Drosophila guanche]